MISDHVAKRFHIYGVLDHYAFISYNMTSTFLNSGNVRKKIKKKKETRGNVGWVPRAMEPTRVLQRAFDSILDHIHSHLYSPHNNNSPITHQFPSHTSLKKLECIERKIFGEVKRRPSVLLYTIKCPQKHTLFCMRCTLSPSLIHSFAFPITLLHSDLRTHSHIILLLGECGF